MNIQINYATKEEFRAIMQSLPYMGGMNGTIFIECNTNTKIRNEDATNNNGLQRKGTGRTA